MIACRCTRLVSSKAKNRELGEMNIAFDCEAKESNQGNEDRSPDTEHPRSDYEQNDTYRHEGLGNTEGCFDCCDRL